MFHSDSGDPASAWQVGRRRTLFQLDIKHRFWTTWDGESFGEDYDRSGGRIYVDSTHAWLTDPVGFSIGFTIGAGKRADGNSDSGADPGSFTGSTSRITRGEPIDAEECGALFLKSIPAIIAKAFKVSLHAEVAELADAHV